MGLTVDIKLDTTKLKNLEKSVKTLSKRHIRFGWTDKKFYPASSSNRGVYVAQVAHWQEFGSSDNGKNIPARPYFRQSINKIRYGYRGDIRNIFDAAIFSKPTYPLLTALSEEFKKEYAGSVLRQNYKRLAPYTISLKGHSFQMVDSGYMIKNFQSKVYRTSHKNIKD